MGTKNNNTGQRGLIVKETNTFLAIKKSRIHIEP